MTANRVESITVQCPYCWEKFELLVDCSVDSQKYIEDCEICCRPIQFEVNVDENGMPDVNVSGENE